MNQGALIAAAGLLAVGAWWMVRQTPNADGSVSSDWIDSAQQGITDTVQQIADAIMPLQLSKMRTVSAEMLGLPNVAAFLRVIRVGEGTNDPGGYQRIVGGASFASFADHPRQTKSGTFSNGTSWRSDAAGAYQFLSSTWDETARIMGLADFSPGNQDLAALGRIAARGALDDVIGGNLTAALRKCAREWASLPGSPYGQPTISADRAAAVFASAGGTAYA